MKKIGVLILLLLLVSCSSAEKNSVTDTFENENKQEIVDVENVGQKVGDLVFYKVEDWKTPYKTILESMDSKTQYTFIDFEKDLTPELIVKNEDEFSIYKYQTKDNITKTEISLDYLDMNVYFYNDKNAESNSIGFGEVENKFLAENKTYYLENGVLIEAQSISFAEGLPIHEKESYHKLTELKFYESTNYDLIDNYFGSVFYENDDIIIWANNTLSIYSDKFNYDLLSRSMYIQYKDTNDTALIVNDFDMPVFNENTNTLAYLIGYEWEEQGSMKVFDVTDRTLKTANLDIEKDYKPSFIRVYNEYILFVDMYSWGTVAKGNNINVYDIKNDLSYPIVTCENKQIQIVDFEIKENTIEYNFVKFDNEMNLYDKFTTEVSLEEVNQAIESKTPIVHNYEDKYIRKIEELEYGVYLAYQNNENIPKRTIIEDEITNTNEGVVFWSERALSDVKIIGLDYVGDTLVENTDYEDKKEIGTLSTDEALLLNRTIPEGVPYWALSFKDEIGEEVRLVLTYDGSGFYESPTYLIIDNK